MKTTIFTLLVSVSHGVLFASDDIPNNPPSHHAQSSELASWEKAFEESEQSTDTSLLIADGSCKLLPPNNGMKTSFPLNQPPFFLRETRLYFAPYYFIFTPKEKEYYWNFLRLPTPNAQDKNEKYKGWMFNDTENKTEVFRDFARQFSHGLPPQEHIISHPKGFEKLGIEQLDIFIKDFKRHGEERSIPPQPKYGSINMFYDMAFSCCAMAAKLFMHLPALSEVRLHFPDTEERTLMTFLGTHNQASTVGKQHSYTNVQALLDGVNQLTTLRKISLLFSSDLKSAALIEQCLCFLIDIPHLKEIELALSPNVPKEKQLHKVLANMMKQSRISAPHEEVIQTDGTITYTWQLNHLNNSTQQSPQQVEHQLNPEVPPFNPHAQNYSNNYTQPYNPHVQHQYHLNNGMPPFNPPAQHQYNLNNGRSSFNPHAQHYSNNYTQPYNPHAQHQYHSNNGRSSFNPHAHQHQLNVRASSFNTRVKPK